MSRKTKYNKVHPVKDIFLSLVQNLSKIVGTKLCTLEVVNKKYKIENSKNHYLTDENGLQSSGSMIFK